MFEHAPMRSDLVAASVAPFNLMPGGFIFFLFLLTLIARLG
jgi:hypothetical protein